MKRFLICLAIVFGLMFVVGTTGFLYVNSLSTTANTEPVTIDIPKGSNSDKIATLLDKQGVLKNKTFFKLVVMKKGIGNKFQSGRYEIQPKDKIDDILNSFVEGNSIKRETVSITIPEGYTLEQIAEKVEEKSSVKKEDFLKAAKSWKGNQWFLKNIPDGDNKLEGFLFPETYEFYQDATPEEIITIMLNQFDKVVSPFKSEIEKKSMTVKDVITIASLIEKEAKDDSDRPLISSVISNRMKKDMLLQVDASILYAIGHKDKLTSDDLDVDSPYNTYKYKGLPPTAICSPGLASIKAAIYPENTSYLYYVVDKNTGSHRFAKTLKEHQANIKKYYK